ncbi:MAG: hypothetical protein ACEY3H_04745, partial [Wolbachia sp.]
YKMKLLRNLFDKKKNIRTDYVTAFVSIKSLGVGFNENKIDHYDIRGMKSFVNKILKNIPSLPN